MLSVRSLLRRGTISMHGQARMEMDLSIEETACRLIRRDTTRCQRRVGVGSHNQFRGVAQVQGVLEGADNDVLLSALR